MSVDPQKIVLNAQRASSRWVAQRYDSAADRPHMIEETLHALSAGIVLAESSDLEALSRIRGQLDEVIE